VCGALQKKPSEGSPIVYDAENRRYRLEVMPGIVVDDAKCIMCGGQGIGIRDRMCNCGSVQQWAASEDSPVYKDQGNGLFTLRWHERPDGKTPHYAIWYCPVCGGRINDD